MIRNSTHPPEALAPLALPLPALPLWGTKMIAKGEGLVPVLSP